MNYNNLKIQVYKMNSEEFARILNQGLSKPYWYDTCVEFNDCSQCPYGFYQNGYYKCEVNNV